MILANNEIGKLVKVLFSGQKAFCPICKGDVFGKIYMDKENHFAHKPNPLCSYSSGNISDWHLKWQSKFLNSEVRYPQLGLIADVVLPKKTIIEFQNSRISFEDIRKREIGHKRMIWLFNLSKFDSEKVYVLNNKLYWYGFTKNWILPTKPFFYHLPDHSIIQIREPKIIRSENLGGYPIYNLVSTIWQTYTLKDWIDTCYSLDDMPIKNFEICENIRYKNETT